MSVPQGEVSITRLATGLFSGLALMFSFGALIVAAGDHGKATPAPEVAHGVVADTAPAGQSADAKIDFSAEPAPGWKAFDPTLAPAAGGTAHAVTLEAGETMLEVAPGVTQQMWTFNHQVPAPVLHGKVGDVFTVTLVNKGTMSHSLDFHASYAAMNDKMRSITPGESLVYQFKAEHSGIWMYHCGTAPALYHIGNGMYGAVVIDPPDLAPVTHEYVMIQSELYAGPAGQPGDLTKMMSNSLDAVVFNGYVNQYKYSPLQVQPNEPIRVWVLDAGPNENSAFHIVGTQFDTVFKEGAFLLRPDNAEHGASQTLDLQPSQGGFVEFSLHDPGTYAMVTHKFSNVGKGALGVLQAGDLAASTTAGH